MGHLGTRPRNPPRPRAVAHALATLGAAVALAAPTTAQALAGGATGSTHTATTPSFPVPSSAKVRPNAGGTALAPTTTIAPTTTTQTSTAAQPATTSPATTSSASAPAHARTSRASKLSAPAIALAALAALLALGCAAWAVARMLAFEPRWLLSLRHALAEGGFRASATWAEFADWARVGK